MRKELAAVLAAGIMLVGGAAFTTHSAMAAPGDPLWVACATNDVSAAPPNGADCTKEQVTRSNDGTMVTFTGGASANIEALDLPGWTLSQNETITFEYNGPCGGGAPRVYVTINGIIYNTADSTEACGVDAAEGWKRVTYKVPTGGELKSSNISGWDVAAAGVVVDNPLGLVRVRNVHIGSNAVNFKATKPPTKEPPKPNPKPKPNDLVSQINSLKVAAEQDAGYVRTLFGNSPTAAQRAAELKRNYDLWPDCVGYYSFADNKCYTAASEVDVDHKVSLKEAWGSGAHAWSPEKRKAFARDAANYWVMTDNLNASKGDDDFAEWNPPYNGADCYYARTYVSVKVKYDLSVDPAEKMALLTQASKCKESGPAPSSATADDSAGSGGLPVTGPGGGVGSLVAMGATGVLLVAGGGLLLVWARRRRDSHEVKSAS